MWCGPLWSPQFVVSNLNDSTPCSCGLCSRNLNLSKNSSENVVSEWQERRTRKLKRRRGRESWWSWKWTLGQCVLCICLMIVKIHRTCSQVVKSEGSRNAGEPSSSLALFHCLQQKWGQPDLGDQKVWEWHVNFEELFIKENISPLIFQACHAEFLRQGMAFQVTWEEHEVHVSTGVYLKTPQVGNSMFFSVELGLEFWQQEDRGWGGSCLVGHIVVIMFK